MVAWVCGTCAASGGWCGRGSWSRSCPRRWSPPPGPGSPWSSACCWTACRDQTRCSDHSALEWESATNLNGNPSLSCSNLVFMIDLEIEQVTWAFKFSPHENYELTSWKQDSFIMHVVWFRDVLWLMFTTRLRSVGWESIVSEEEQWTGSSWWGQQW